MSSVTLDRLAAMSETTVIPTVTEKNVAYAIVQTGGTGSGIEIAGGVTQAFGISRGTLAYTVDEDLYLLDLRTGERARMLAGFQVLQVAWKPSSLSLAAVVRGVSGQDLLVAGPDTSDTGAIEQGSVWPGFIRWSEDGQTLFYVVISAEHEARLIRHDSHELTGSVRIDQAVLPFLAAASDSALRFGDFESELRSWIGRDTLIPVARIAGGALAQTRDDGGVYFAPTNSMETHLILQSRATAKSEKAAAEAVVQAASSFGTYLGEFQGVSVYSNGSSSYYSGTANYVGSVYTGIKWQCVEYVRRYFLQVNGLDLGSLFRGDANQWYNNASQMNLDRFPNGGNASPEVGDILVSEGGPSGHVAIVRSRAGNQVCTVQQNFSNDGTDVNRCMTLTVSGSAYTLGGFSQSYPVRGWLRKLSSKAVMSTPAPGSTLSGSSVTFGWTAGTGVSRYWLYVGNSTGAYDIYGNDQGSNRSVTVNNLPTDGRTIYVRLWSYLSSGWQYNDYTYRAATLTSTATRAVMSTPTPGSTLSGSSVTFAWTAGTGVSRYWLYIGNVTGGYDIYANDQGTNRSVTVNNLPTGGRIIYVRLWSYLSSGWQYNDYAYRTGR